MKNNIYKTSFAAAVLLITPSVAFAVENLNELIGLITKYLSNFIGLIISFAIVTFIFNVVRYFIVDEEKRKDAATYVLYSTIGFFVILSIWGLVALLTNTFKLNNAAPAWPFGAGNGGATQQNTGTTQGGFTPNTNGTVNAPNTNQGVMNAPQTFGGVMNGQNSSGGVMNAPNTGK